MTEDPSAGYIVKGYYADDDIAGAPLELKKLGTMQDLNKILDSKMNDTINGSCNGLMRFSAACRIRNLTRL